MVTTKSTLVALALSVVLAGGSLQAQQQADLAPALAAQNTYRIGLACSEVSEALRVHLRLPDDAGLLIDAVLDGSPADRAGLQRFDIVVQAAGKPVSSVADLVEVVNEVRDNAMDMAIIRRGEEQKVQVTPEERPAGETAGQLPGTFRGRFEDLPPSLRRHLDQFEEHPIPGQPGFGLRRFLPGLMLDDSLSMQQLPKNFSLHVERTDDGPAKITVRRGDQEWTVTEDNLDELPKDLRPLVRNMLNGRRDQLFGLMVPDADGELVPRPRDRSGRQMDKRFDGLELQLKELQDAIRAMQEDRR